MLIVTGLTSRDLVLTSRDLFTVGKQPGGGVVSSSMKVRQGSAPRLQTTSGGYSAQNPSYMRSSTRQASAQLGHMSGGAMVDRSMLPPRQATQANMPLDGSKTRDSSAKQHQKTDMPPGGGRKSSAKPFTSSMV